MAAPAATPRSDIEAFIKKLDAQTEGAEALNSVRLDVHYNRSRMLLLQANMYSSMKDIPRAYIMYKRLARFLIVKIPKHNAYQLMQYSRDKAWGKKTAGECLLHIEATKSLMMANYDEIVRKEVERRRAARGAAAPAPADAPAPSAPEPSAPPPDGPPPAYGDAPPPYTPGTGGGGGTAGGRALDPEVERSLSFLTLDGSTPRATPRATPRTAATSTPISTPKAPRAAPLHVGRDAHVPALGVVKPPPAATPAPATGRTAASLPTHVGNLRAIRVPHTLLQVFTDIAAPNSRTPPRGIETCGVLCGKIGEAGHLEVTTLVVPKQKGKADTCELTDEAELFEVCMARNVLVLGWIHTHPSQDCFLSSMDLHTHCGFQSMMPEAIAIVLAPTDRRQQYGVFRLTDPPGLGIIQACRKDGFHPHSNPAAIYEHTRHVQWVTSALDKVDMR